MKTRELGAIALGLVGLHTLALPITTAEVNRALGFGAPIVSGCGCGTGNLEASTGLTATSLRDASGFAVGTLGEPAPLDPEPCPLSSEDCTTSIWDWWVCLKVNNNPLTCWLYKKEFKRWICAGGNFHCCISDWEQVGENCSGAPGPPANECQQSNPETLPSGCNPPITQSDVCDCS